MSETPRAWFLAENDEDETGYSAAARMRPPLIAEVWRNGEWIVNQGNLWETLQEDPGWVEVTEAEAEAWIASRSAATAPGSAEQSAEG